MRDLEARDLDGLLVVMLTYGPGMRVARLLAQTPLPVCLANIQPVPAVTAEWDMADLTYNQGIHGAQDTANAIVRAGRPFHVVTDDWRAESFREAIGVWARAAAAVSRWRSLKVGVFGYAMNGMGDIRFDEHSLLRALGPQVDALAPGALQRAAAAVGAESVARLLAEEDSRFEIDARLTAEEREDHARMQLGLERVLADGGYGAFSTHFGAIAEDGRFARLPLAAASSLMAKGYGYAAEGDALTAALMCAARDLLGETQFTEMYAMDFPSDSILMSHMGEGNWALARSDRPVRLIKRPLGIGGLGDPPTFLFQYAPGPATLATLVSLGGERFRLVVSEGEILDTDELPALEMPYGFFRPDSGVRECMNAWLRLGGPHHQVLNQGRRAAAWRVFCELAGVEFASA
jgi:L-arabinose isomerase